ncbi:MAG: GerMN domain-containing protein [Oscillospiraceae bacterium]|jgi:spore germination protein GerM
MNPWTKSRSNSMWICMAATLLAFCFLAGCRLDTEEPNASSAIVLVHYLVNLEKTPISQRAVVQAVPSGLSPVDATPEELLQLLQTNPGDETLYAPLPEGTNVRTCRQEGKRLFLDLSAVYGQLKGYELTRSNCAIAMTLTQLSDVEEVVLTVEGEPIPGWEQGKLGRGLALTSDAEPEVSPIEVALYFWNTESGGLQAEYRTLSAQQDAILAANIVQALIDGPEQRGLEALLPEGTTLLSISIEHRCCAITLSDVFWMEVPASAQRQEAVLRSVVDSLKNLDFIDSVYFLNTKGAAVYGGISLDQPLS